MTIIDRCGQIDGITAENSTFRLDFVEKSVESVYKSYKSSLPEVFSHNSEYLDMLCKYNDK